MYKPKNQPDHYGRTHNMGTPPTPPATVTTPTTINNPVKIQKPGGPAKDTLRIIPLGGNEEVGRNMTIFEYGGDIVILDMGMQFPEEDMPGIDYIIPNMSYFKGKEKNIRGVIISHAHYDHIGAIPHTIPRLGYPPIYALPLTNAIIKKRQEDYKGLKPLDIHNVKINDKLKLGGFVIEERKNEEFPFRELISYKEAGLQFLLDDGKVTAIRISPLIKDDNIMIWPEEAEGEL